MGKEKKGLLFEKCCKQKLLLKIIVKENHAGMVERNDGWEVISEALGSK